MSSSQFAYKINNPDPSVLSSQTIAIKTISMFLTVSGFTYQFGYHMISQPSDSGIHNMATINNTLIQTLNALSGQFSGFKANTSQTVSLDNGVSSIQSYNPFTISKTGQNTYKINFVLGSEEINSTDVGNFQQMIGKIIGDLQNGA